MLMILPCRLLLCHNGLKSNQIVKHETVNPIFTILVSLASALVASAFTQWLVFRFNERQRRLELYKIVYPERFKAIKEFMATADELVTEVINAPNSKQDQSASGKLMEKIKELNRKADANRWLFGENITDLATEVGNLMKNNISPSPPMSNDIAMSETFRKLNTIVDNELGISELSDTFSISRRSKKRGFSPR